LTATTTSNSGPRIDYAYAALINFHYYLSQTDNSAFRFISRPARKGYWTTTCDACSSGLDTVDLLFNVTHGGVNTGTPTTAGWNMWEWPTDSAIDTALSNTMRLGDNGRGLSFFASTACQNLYFDDGKLGERWWPILAGGLKMSLGAYCNLYGGSEMSVVGALLPQYLQAGYPVSASWYYALTYVDPQLMIAELATGANGDDCNNRLYNMSWLNHTNGSYPHLGDGQIQVGCFSYNDSTYDCGV
jgi:hypothetical protein